MFFLLLHFTLVFSQVPQQIHIAFTGNPSSVSIIWTSPLQKPYQVLYGLNKDKLNKKVEGKYHYYSSTPGYSSVIHEGKLIFFILALLKDLPTRHKIYYKIGRDETWTKTFHFETAPQEKYMFKFITYGDMDIARKFKIFLIFLDDGQNTVDFVKKLKGHQFIIHLGDMPYAWSGQENKWDIWGKLVEPITNYYPYMICPGNHEENANFTSFKNRFTNITGVNSGSNTNLFYSWDYSYVHFISLSTEHNFNKGSEQYNWLRRDLEKVDRKKTPHIIVYQHRPMYSSNQNHGSNKDYREKIEPLLYQFKVDLLLFGHVHAYERTCPVYQGKCKGKFSKHFVKNPQAPIHICTGTAGFELNPNWDPKPEWSMFRDASHGITTIIVSKRTIFIEFFQNHQKYALDTFLIEKDV